MENTNEIANANNEGKAEENKYNLPAVKAMNYAQIKELRKKNLDPAISGSTTEINSGMVDFILENVYPESSQEFNGIPYYILLKLVKDTYKMTVGGPEAIKN